MPVIIKTDQPKGNACVIMGIVSNILQQIYGREGAQSVIDEYLEEAKSGDYENLKKVSLRYVNKNCVGGEPLLIFTTSENVSESVIDDDKAEWKWWEDDDVYCSWCGQEGITDEECPCNNY